MQCPPHNYNYILYRIQIFVFSILHFYRINAEIITRRNASPRVIRYRMLLILHSCNKVYINDSAVVLTRWISQREQLVEIALSFFLVRAARRYGRQFHDIRAN